MKIDKKRMHVSRKFILNNGGDGGVNDDDVVGGDGDEDDVVDRQTIDIARQSDRHKENGKELNDAKVKTREGEIKKTTKIENKPYFNLNNANYPSYCRYTLYILFLYTLPLNVTIKFIRVHEENQF